MVVDWEMPAFEPVSGARVEAASDQPFVENGEEDDLKGAVR